MFVHNISNILYTNPYQRNTSFQGLKPNKLSQPRIKNCEYGVLPQQTQDIIAHIQENWFKIKAYFDALKTKQVKCVQIRKNYETLIRRNNKQGLTFQTPDNKELVTVLQSRTKDKNLIRFIIENGEDTTHLLVDTPDKVVKNLDATNPYYLPQKFRYMTDSEMQSSNISRYAKFIDIEVDKYNDYLIRYDELFPRKRKAPANPIIRKPKVKEVPEIKTYTVKDALDIFDEKNTKIPSHINRIVSPRSGQILAVNLKTSEGSTLKISKKINSEFDINLRYLSFEEILPNGTKKYLNIDMDTKEFLKNSLNGKPIIDDEGMLHIYTDEELASYDILARFNKYMNEIFTPSKSKSPQQTEVTVFEIKTKSKNREISLEEIEDKNLLKKLDREIGSTINED